MGGSLLFRLLFLFLLKFPRCSLSFKFLFILFTVHNIPRIFTLLIDLVSSFHTTYETRSFPAIMTDLHTVNAWSASTRQARHALPLRSWPLFVLLVFCAFWLFIFLRPCFTSTPKPTKPTECERRPASPSASVWPCLVSKKFYKFFQILWQNL